MHSTVLTTETSHCLCLRCGGQRDTANANLQHGASLYLLCANRETAHRPCWVKVREEKETVAK